MVWPKSGCSTSTPVEPNRRTSASVFAGTSAFLPDSANSQAMRMTKAGFRNSDGWRLMPNSTIQRRAPFTSAPKKSVATTSTKLAANTSSATRRIVRGDMNEVTIITAIAGTRYTTWRLTK